MRDMMRTKPQFLAHVHAELTLERICDQVARALANRPRITRCVAQDNEIVELLRAIRDDRVHVLEPDPCGVEAEVYRPHWEEVGVLHPVQSLFLGGSNDLSVSEQHRRAIVISEPRCVIGFPQTWMPMPP